MESEGKNVIRVGSRKSELALIQTNFVIDSLKKIYPDKEFIIVTMTTLGDRILDVSLPKIGEKSLFTKDLEDALRNDTVDFVVHSLKDLPTALPEGLAIGAVFEREDPRDALVLREDNNQYTLATLPEGSVIGTSSLRRCAQLRASYPNVTVQDVRGNLNTRLRKLDSPTKEYSALLLANAGLQRMGWGHRVSKVLPCAEIMYAVGQGALAVECASNKQEILSMLAPFNHVETYCRVLAERSFLATLGGGCSAPVGVSTKLKGVDTKFELSISGAVWSLDGATKIKHSLQQSFDQIKKTQKHKISPTEDSDHKKLKFDHGTDSGDVTNKVFNPLEELDRRIALKVGNISCVDTRTPEEIEALRCEPKIYCGLIENTNMPLDVIVKCEKLGKDLAQALVEKGAIDVMKISQDYIRSSTIKKS